MKPTGPSLPGWRCEGFFVRIASFLPICERACQVTKKLSQNSLHYNSFYSNFCISRRTSPRGYIVSTSHNCSRALGRQSWNVIRNIVRMTAGLCFLHYIVRYVRTESVKRRNEAFAEKVKRRRLTDPEQLCKYGTSALTLTMYLLASY